MPVDDFLAGAALYAAMLALVATATALVVRRRLRHLDLLELGLASVAVGTAILIAVHLVPLMLAILTRGTVLAAAVVAVGLARLVKPAVPLAEPEDRGPPRPPSSRFSWAIAAVAALYAAAAGVAELGRWAGDEVVGDDATSFHLPGIARWIQERSIWQIDQFVPLLAQGYYPNNGDVVLLSAVLPWHNDFLARVPMAFYLAVTAVAVFAVARELRASHAGSLLAAAVVVSLPVVGVVTIPRALPDSLLYATFAIGVLHLLRHARTGRRSDLVLAGLALAIAAGTKWYGVSSVPVVVAIWAGARLLAARREGAPRAPALRDGVLVGGLVLAGMLPWFVRNLALAGNPFFPLDLAPFGVTIFGAPPDVIRDELGFSIADYAGEPDVLAKVLVKIAEGLGLAPFLCVLAIAAAIVLARRSGRAGDARIVVLVAGAVALAIVYTLTPASALGVRGNPGLAHVNTRYLIPALILAVPVAVWAAGRLPRVAGRTLEGLLMLGALLGAHEGYEIQGGREIVVALTGLAAIAGGCWLLWRLRERRVVLVAAAIGAVLIGLAAGNRGQNAINTDRYRDVDPALDALLANAPSERRVGLAFATYWSLGDLSPAWPAFGTRIGNEVEYVGRFVDGFLTPYGDAASFAAALRRGRYDVLAVGRSTIESQDTPEQGWAIAAGWQTISLSDELRVLVPPAAVTAPP